MFVMRLLIFLILFFSNTVFANERAIIETARRSGYSVEDVKKYHVAGCDTGSPSLMQICGTYSFVESDLLLNYTYQQLLTRLKAKSIKAKLRLVQRAWVKQRDESCESESTEENGGQIKPFLFVGCITTLTGIRIQKINNALSCVSNRCIEDEINSW